MAEAGAVETSVVEPVVVEPAVVEPVATETHDDPDHEPGGSTPQDIRARKEYRLRKRLEGEVFELQQERTATNARLKTLEEVTKPQPSKQRVYTTQELQAAVDAGTISVVEAADYLAEHRARQTADRVLKQERVRDDESSRQARAQEQIDKYVEVAPWLKDKYDSRRKPLETEYVRLIDSNGIYRYPDNVVTEALLLEKTLGSLETFKAKIRLDKSSGSNTQFHTESGAGGAAPTPKPADGKADMSKMPKHFIEYWDKSGTSQKEREKEAKLYFEKRGQPK